MPHQLSALNACENITTNICRLCKGFYLVKKVKEKRERKYGLVCEKYSNINWFFYIINKLKLALPNDQKLKLKIKNKD